VLNLALPCQIVWCLRIRKAVLNTTEFNTDQRQHREEEPQDQTRTAGNQRCQGGITRSELTREVTQQQKDTDECNEHGNLLQQVVSKTRMFSLISHLILRTPELTRQKAPAFWLGAVTGYTMISFFVLTYNIKLQPENARDYQRKGQNTTQKIQIETI
jgi:hypothetical protein